jgi:hypothetical protein
MTTTIMLCTTSFLPLLRLSLPRLLAVGITPVVYSCSEDVAAEVERLGGIPRLFPRDDGGGDYGTPAFAAFVSAKFDAITDALLRFGPCLFLDTDVMVDQNPLATIDEACDIFAQNDTFGEIAFRGDIVCTGCWWLSDSHAVLDFLSAARARQVRESAERFCCDEMAVFDELRDWPELKVGFAQLDQWQNASRWLASGKTTAPQLIHWNGPGRYTVADKLAALTPAGSPSSRRAEPAPISERTAQ